MQKNNISKKAFTLVELSIVLIIIGLLVVGVIGGSRLIDSAKITSARSLTKSAPVIGIEDLKFWVEATSKDSFAVENPEDNDSIALWNDLNLQSTIKNNATQTGADSIKPKYTKNGINGLPAISLDGLDDFFDLNGGFLAQTNYTIFVVEQLGSAETFNLFIGTKTESIGDSLIIGYRNSTTITHGHFSSDYDITTADYRPANPLIHTFEHSSNFGKRYHQNGSLMSGVAHIDNNASINDHLLTGNNGMTIGYYSASTNQYYIGDIGEIIIYSRNLKDSERQAVESYLSKKWKISLQS
jgi:prepilin-type N-terminal cleavage/methylation domain-containing protein